jgi:hypothetical protein
MIETSDRIEQFRTEIADMKLKTGRTNKEGALLILSVILMVGGIVLAFGAYEAALNVKVTTATNVDILNSNAYFPLSVTGLAISVVGGFLFLRYSLAKFLRFWLLRQSYEQKVAIDEVAKTLSH